MVKTYFNKIKSLYFKYERIILPLSFIAGILSDNFTLRRIDLLYENSVFILNLTLVLLYILLINAYDAKRLQGVIFDKTVIFVPILLQFAFGNLFSAFVIFYVRSSSVFTSWPFLFILLALFLGNDFLRKKYLRLTFQVSMLFMALFSYSVFVLPILLNKMGAEVFLLSGFAAILSIGIILLLLFFVIPERFKSNFKAIFLSVGGIYIIFNFFYFMNIIPPIPLSLKESGIYHSVELYKNEGYLYKTSYEPASPYLFFKDQSDIFHWTPGAPVYYYSAVFSPTDLNITILHRWSYFDETKKEWIEKLRIPYSVTGGRDGGYRGYSYSTNIKPGKWKTEVITERGQVLGGRVFNVVKTNSLPNLEIKLH